jgi:hypothetical protein
VVVNDFAKYFQGIREWFLTNYLLIAANNFDSPPLLKNISDGKICFWVDAKNA